MTGVYVLLISLLVVAIANTVILVGLGLFLLRFASSIRENRESVASAVEDITDMIRLIRGNFEDLKNFIRSII